MSTIDRKRNSLRKRQGMAKEKAKGKCWCCRRFLAFLFSHIGLGFLVFSYSLIGAFIFRYFEEPYERGKASEVLTIRNTTVHNLWTETLKLNVLYKENWTSMASKEIEKFQQNLIQAVREGYDGKESGNANQQWSLSGSWMYSLTVISTIGYGNRPRTPEGKVATIVYAIIGIPLMLLFLTNIGHMLAKGFKCLYGYCCNCSNSDTSNEQQNLHTHSHHMHDHYHVHHIALNEVSPTGHLIHCNSTGDPYRTTKCYSACNSNSNREQYTVGGLEAETKLCTDIGDHHSCAGTLNRAHSHSHHSILRGATADTSDLMNANNMEAQTSNEDQNVSVPIILCVLLIIGYVLLGATLFYTWEGSSILDGSYIAFCLLSTIGFGDLMPGHSILSGRDGSQKKLIITSAYIIGGMALIAMSFNLVHEQVLHKMKRCGKKLGLFSDEPEIDLSTNQTHDEDFDV